MPFKKNQPDDSTEKRLIAVDMSRNTWTPAMAAAWSGIPYRTLLMMMRQGRAPCIPIGESQAQKWPRAGDGKRRRACFKYMVPRVSFMRWYESIGRPDSGGMGTAA